MKKCRKRLKLKGVFQNSLYFIHGVFFEVLVCVSMSMRMLDYYEYLNDSDKASIGLQFFFAVILFAYLMYVFYFTIFKTGTWVKKNKADKLKK